MDFSYNLDPEMDTQSWSPDMHSIESSDRSSPLTSPCSLDEAALAAMHNQDTMADDILLPDAYFVGDLYPFPDNYYAAAAMFPPDIPGQGGPLLITDDAAPSYPTPSTSQTEQTPSREDVDANTTTAAPASVNKLRTAVRKHRKKQPTPQPSADPSPASAPRRGAKTTATAPAAPKEKRTARSKHNRVEKEYRNRLNDQFERLVAVLPSPPQSAAEDGADGGGTAAPAAAPGTDGNGRRLSKAEVLDMARRHIRALEKQNRILRHERALVVDRLKAAEARR